MSLPCYYTIFIVIQLLPNKTASCPRSIVTADGEVNCTTLEGIKRLGFGKVRDVKRGSGRTFSQPFEHRSADNGRHELGSRDTEDPLSFGRLELGTRSCELRRQFDNFLDLGPEFDSALGRF